MLSQISMQNRPCFHEVTVVRKIVTQSECNFCSLPSLRENSDEMFHSVRGFFSKLTIFFPSLPCFKTKRNSKCRNKKKEGVIKLHNSKEIQCPKDKTMQRKRMRGNKITEREIFLRLRKNKRYSYHIQLHMHHSLLRVGSHHSLKFYKKKKIQTNFLFKGIR